MFCVYNVYYEYCSWFNCRLLVELIVDWMVFVIDVGMLVILFGDMNVMYGVVMMDILWIVGVEFGWVDGFIYYLNCGINLFGVIDYIGIID